MFNLNAARRDLQCLLAVWSNVSMRNSHRIRYDSKCRFFIGQCHWWSQVTGGVSEMQGQNLRKFQAASRHLLNLLYVRYCYGDLFSIRFSEQEHQVVKVSFTVFSALRICTSLQVCDQTRWTVLRWKMETIIILFHRLEPFETLLWKFCNIAQAMPYQKKVEVGWSNMIRIVSWHNAWFGKKSKNNDIFSEWWATGLVYDHLFRK